MDNTTNNKTAGAAMIDLPNGRRIWIPPTGKPYWIGVLAGRSGLDLSDEEIKEHIEQARPRHNTQRHIPAINGDRLGVMLKALAMVWAYAPWKWGTMKCRSCAEYAMEAAARKAMGIMHGTGARS